MAAQSGESSTSPDALVVGYATAFAWAAGLLIVGGLLWFILVRVRLSDLAPPAPSSDVPSGSAA